MASPEGSSGSGTPKTLHAVRCSRARPRAISSCANCSGARGGGKRKGRRANREKSANRHDGWPSTARSHATQTPLPPVLHALQSGFRLHYTEGEWGTAEPSSALSTSCSTPSKKGLTTASPSKPAQPHLLSCQACTMQGLLCAVFPHCCEVLQHRLGRLGGHRDSLLHWVQGGFNS